ncbi:hypothetical protein NADFUDRAFT_81867 [Nadsonia fulvescens var. elongata DSM 6958]|uniref:Membrane insertase YidC/Oxa/ALB C-terminal domain-containing protein n=1 Tax=Nadsonia fulvescens var. elongata DSM 6958 TaxID=857566 RepID=A0A1E3PPK8_9ASCO|nr:hypothetical protein NADFUDRAFT_81867 [Nadsonia fulvescens var. elongata DSM 6958]
MIRSALFANQNIIFRASSLSRGNFLRASSKLVSGQNFGKVSVRFNSSQPGNVIPAAIDAIKASANDVSASASDSVSAAATTVVEAVAPSTVAAVSETAATVPETVVSEAVASSSSIHNEIANMSSIVDNVSITSDQLGYLQSVGLAQTWYWPADFLQHVLEMVHVYSGLPWWGTIVATAIAVRVAFFPLFLKASDTAARMAPIKPQIDQLSAEARRASNPVEIQKIGRKRKTLLAEHGVQMKYSFFPILQMPFSIGFFLGLRRMAEVPVDGFTTQGAYWFTDLAASDPFIILPVASAAIFSATIYGGGELAQSYGPMMKKVMMYLPIVSIPITMFFSSAIVLYFFVNSALGFLQSFLLRNNAFRQWCGIAIKVDPPLSDKPVENKSIRETFKDYYEQSLERSQAAKEARDLEEESYQKLKNERKNVTIELKKKN